MMQTFKKEKLTVHSFESRGEMGRAAAQDIKKAILQVLEQKECCNMIFAAAPSQNEVLQELASGTDIPWERVNAFHMDEYIGLAADAPQGFANFLRQALFSRVPFANVYCLNSEGEPEKEIARYSQLLHRYPTDIVVMGVGENGHIAFNDPHVAKFDDEALVKQVELDDTCRMQQVHDGCFACLEDVPRMALTLTVPALCAAKQAFCIVPGPTKAAAVARMIKGPVEEACPASILRRHPAAVLYLDSDSAALLR